MKKLAFAMVLVLLMALMAVPVYAAPAASDDPSASRDEEILPELPDPNDPESPEYVIIDEDGVPMGYIKIEDPDNPGEYIYVLEEELDEDDTPLSGLPDWEGGEEELDDGEVPLVMSPQTGEQRADTLLAAAVMLCAAGVAVLAVSKKKAAV